MKPQPPASFSQTITVLVADDHPLFRHGLVEVLKADSDLRLLAEAGDGPTALQLVQQHRPQVAILDVRMPKISGLDVARAVRAARLPVALIFLTMYDDEETFQEAMELGVQGYVLKDSALSEIVAAVKTVAAGKHHISASLASFLIQRQARTAALQKAKPGLSELTPAERRILKMIAEDQTTKEIAALLGLSPRTIETHRLHIAEKLNLHGTHSLLKFAFEHKARL